MLLPAIIRAGCRLEFVSRREIAEIVRLVNEALEGDLLGAAEHPPLRGPFSQTLQDECPIVSDSSREVLKYIHGS